MSILTTEQQRVLDLITKEGRGTSYFIAKELGLNWSSARVGRIMQQLKYRSLVEFNGVTWQIPHNPEKEE
jgi:alkylated DNA nucleotide flippase Atl1